MKKFLPMLCLAFSLAGPLTSSADPPPKADNEGFVPESRPANMNAAASVEEGMPAAPLVVTAYGFIWLATMVFVGSVALRARRLEGKVADLESRLAQRGVR